MSVIRLENMDLCLVENTFWVLTKSISPSYDFDFETHFHCQKPNELPETCIAVSRAGARVFYNAFYHAVLRDGVQLIHNPETHQLCDELPKWYPLIENYTPRSMWFNDIPSIEVIMEHFEFPIFVRGASKTKRHSKALSILENPDDYARIRQAYSRDPILSRQKFVCREFVPLRKVSDVDEDMLPASFEFRTFWWRGTLVGSGRYWMNVPAYDWSDSEKADAITVAEQAAATIPAPFIAIDVGQTVDGNWIVIEINDAQDCGYGDVLPLELWQKVLAAERKHMDLTS